MKTILQSALNRFLQLDPETKKRLHPLHGKIAVVELSTAIPMEFVLAFEAEEIKLLPQRPLNPDLIIRGMPLALLRLSLSTDKRQHFMKNNVVIKGNVELGQRVTDLFEQLEIDWEELVAQRIGDVPAHQIGRAVRGFKQFSKRVKNTMLRNINEYVHEETQWFPTQEELQDFFAEVDSLRMDADRIEARIIRMMQRDKI